ncbi:hypothetical protein EVAR_51525_1 [Eumeta japonica]|uniref:Uncharacterized protein n=1 Tax=Eumeta variegata TaxID=151549 RepID=A0A4C1XDB9_EUMVA|nr:hypothetical protein EVAR_51525_1 [Eumeta japonica]
MVFLERADHWQISIAVGRVAPTLRITTAPASVIDIANTSGILILKSAVEVAAAAHGGKRKPLCTNTCYRTTYNAHAHTTHAPRAVYY